MTENEAIEWLSPKTSPMKIHNAEMEGESPLAYINEAIDVSIKALEKQIAKKPIDVRKFADLHIGLCPTCNEGINSQMNYCDKCGNKLDWGNEDAE